MRAFRWYRKKLKRRELDIAIGGVRVKVTIECVQGNAGKLSRSLGPATSRRSPTFGDLNAAGLSPICFCSTPFFKTVYPHALSWSHYDKRCACFQ